MAISKHMREIKRHFYSDGFQRHFLWLPKFIDDENGDEKLLWLTWVWKLSHYRNKKTPFSFCDIYKIYSKK